MTAGLTTLLEWSKQRGVYDETHFLAQLLRLPLLDWPGHNLIHALAEPSTRELISDWALDRSEARVLNQLAEVAAKDHAFLKAHPVKDLVAPGAAFKKKLGQCFLSAALTVAFPWQPTPQNRWRQVLVFWLLVHAIERAENGNIADRNLQIISRALYSFRDVTSRKGYLLREICSHFYSDYSFYSVNGSIRDRADRLLIELDTGEQDFEDERHLLVAVIAAGKFARTTSADGTFVAEVQLLQLKKYHLASAPAVSFGDIDADSAGSDARALADTDAHFHQGGDDEEDVGDFKPPAGASESEQKALGRGILVLSAEQRHLLPWTWTTPNPIERLILDRWISQQLTNEDLQVALLALFVFIARECGRSLSQVLYLRITEDVGEEWSLSSCTGILRRLPPVRRSSWKPIDETQQKWVHGLVSSQSVSLPEGWQARFKAIARDLSGGSLGELWKVITDRDCEEFFLSILGETLPRLRPSMLANVLLQGEFQRKADDAYARILASGPRTGLPASCGYGSWQLDDLPSAFRPSGHRVTADVIALGSRLSVIEDLLVASIASARDKIEARREGPPLDFHNALVAMLVVKLFAASAARPVKDSFESPAHFNDQRSFVYVDDKASGEARQGRLVPLPPELIKEIFGEYGRHLCMVIDLVRHAHPVMAEQIQALTEGQRSAMPYFFFLESNDGVLRWKSVSEASIDSLELFDWPLPLNLFRHRLAQRLRRLKLNAEIIDGLLGHAESHGASYGDHSFRVWHDDMELARPLLKQCYESLAFQSMASWDTPPTALPTAQRCDPLQKSFGILARSEARQKLRKASFKVAKEMIQEYLGARSLADLSSEEVYELSKRLLLAEDGRPSFRGNFRYDYLLLRVRREESKFRRRVKLRRRFFWDDSAKSPFLPLAVTAEKRLATLKHKLDELEQVAACAAAGREDAEFNRLVPALRFAMIHHIANPAIVKDLFLGRSVRFVFVGGQCELEHGDFAESIEYPHTPVQRFQISDRLARLLRKNVRTPHDREILDMWATKSIQGLADALSDAAFCVPVTINAAIEAIASVIDQINVFTRPGVAAGVLAGRVSTYSTTWPDLSLIRTGQRRRFRKELSPSEDEREDTDYPPLLNGAPPKRKSPSTADERELLALARREAARKFSRSLHRLLDGRPLHPGDGVEKAISRARRGPAIRRLVSELRDTVSSAILLLGEWVAFLLTDKGGRRDIASIDRYFKALFPAFRVIAYDVDLLKMGSDEITGLYVKIIESLEVKHKAYVAARLHEFHRWAERSDYSLPSPDWSEIPESPPRVGVLPGLLAEQEYLTALQLISSAKGLSDDVRRAAGMIMISSYRFGLREEEGWGLLRSDWVEIGGITLLLVKHNHLRGLKGIGSRRQVPLMFNLAQAEHELLAQVKAFSASVNGDKLNVGILADSKGTMPVMNAAVFRVNEVLKQVTGNQRVSVHHLRHSFGNRLVLAAIGNVGHWAERLGWQGDDRQKIREFLLGETLCFRRLGWAVARMLGHMGPTTTFRSYVHCLVDWSAGQDDGTCDATQGMIPGIENLDARATHEMPSTILLKSGKARSADFNFASALRFLRLLSRGWTPDRAANELGVDPETAKALAQSSVDIGRRLVIKKKRDEYDPDDCDHSDHSRLEYLRRITESGWQRLMEMQPRASKSPGEPLEINAFSDLVGATRQILLWESGQMNTVWTILDVLGIANDRYEVIAANCVGDDLMSDARKSGFMPSLLSDVLKRREIESTTRRTASAVNVIPIDNASRRKKRKGTTERYNSVQLDVARTGPAGKHLVPERIALVFKEDGAETPRNPTEFVVAGLAVMAQLVSQGRDVRLH